MFAAPRLLRRAAFSSLEPSLSSLEPWARVTRHIILPRWVQRDHVMRGLGETTADAMYMSRCTMPRTVQPSPGERAGLPNLT